MENQTITQAEIFDQKLKTYCFNPANEFYIKNLETFLFWRLLVMEKITIRHAEYFRWNDFDESNLALHHRKIYRDGQRTQVKRSYLISNETGELLHQLKFIIWGQPWPKHSHREYQPIFPYQSHRTIEMRLTRTFSTIGFNVTPGQAFETFSLPRERELEAWQAVRN